MSLCVCVFVCVFLRVCVYVSQPPRALITTNVKCTCKIYSKTFHILYMTLVIDKMNEYGRSNTECHEHLPKKAKLMLY